MKLRNISKVVLAVIALGMCCHGANAEGYKHEYDTGTGWHVAINYPWSADVVSRTANCNPLVGTINTTITWGGGTPPSDIWITEVASDCSGVPMDPGNGEGDSSALANTSISTAYERWDGYHHSRKAQSWGSSIRHIVVNTESPQTITSSIDYWTHASVSGGNSGIPVGALGLWDDPNVPGYAVSISTQAPEAPKCPWPPHINTGTTDPITPGFDPGNGGTQSGGDPVDLANGNHLYLPGADVSVYNPVGPSVCYQRNFISSRAKNGDGNGNGYCSPGLSCGWVDNYDVQIGTVIGDQSKLKLIYPNGAYDEIAIVSPGQLKRAPGTPYEVTGVYEEGQFTSITITWKQGQTKWTFMPAETGKWRLASISNRHGSSIFIRRASAANYYRVMSITDDSGQPSWNGWGGHPDNRTLLSFQYDVDTQHLSSVTDDHGGRKVTYTFSGDNLNTVSQLTDTEDTPVHATYGYDETVTSHPYLHTVSVPSPTGTGVSTQTFDHDTQGRISRVADANGNQRFYTYEYNGYLDQTRVDVVKPNGSKQIPADIVTWWVQHFNIQNNLNTGVTNALGHRTYLMYSVYSGSADSECTTKPTCIIDANGKHVLISYDKYGNVTNIRRPRSTTTAIYDVEHPPINSSITYTYDYTVCPTGRLTKVEEGNKTATNIYYYGQGSISEGLIEYITYPAPDGSLGTMSFTYNNRGDILTVTTPGNNAASSVTTTYGYVNGSLGHPTLITDSLGHETHISYDSRGNVESVTDAMGRTTNFEYNVADQVKKIILPAIPAQ